MDKTPCLSLGFPLHSLTLSLRCLLGISKVQDSWVLSWGWEMEKEVMLFSVSPLSVDSSSLLHPYTLRPIPQIRKEQVFRLLPLCQTLLIPGSSTHCHTRKGSFFQQLTIFKLWHEVCIMCNDFPEERWSGLPYNGNRGDSQKWKCRWRSTVIDKGRQREEMSNIVPYILTKWMFPPILQYLLILCV